MLSAGYRWPRGPKLFRLGASCVIAYEGDTQLAYPLLVNATNFISLSDNLSAPDAEPISIFERVKLDITEAYTELVSNNGTYFRPGDAICSFVLAGWSRRLCQPVVRHLSTHPSLNCEWDLLDVTQTQCWNSHACFFIGNGNNDPVALAYAAALQNSSTQHIRFPAYAALLGRIRDRSETGVGGTPQIARLDPCGREFIGTNDSSGRRYLLGNHVISGARNVNYFDEDLTTLT